MLLVFFKNYKGYVYVVIEDLLLFNEILLLFCVINNGGKL